MTAKQIRRIQFYTRKAAQHDPRHPRANRFRRLMAYKEALMQLLVPAIE